MCFTCIIILCLLDKIFCCLMSINVSKECRSIHRTYFITRSEQLKTHTITRVRVAIHLCEFVTSASRRHHPSNTRVRVFTRVVPCVLRLETAKLATGDHEGGPTLTMHPLQTHTEYAA